LGFKGLDTMKPITVIVCVLAFVPVVLAAAPEIPQTPAAVEDLVYARPFTLEKGFKYIWSKERPNVTVGTLLVLRVDKALVVPRAIATPVLYVGDQSAERVNYGNESGHVIALVPGHVDLTEVPIWFGTPGFAWRIDTATAKAERALAEQAGIKPFSKEVVEAALAKGGEPIQTTDKRALLRDQVAELILEYSPQEKHLAEDFRVPDIKRPAETDNADPAER
jgi:hypothetical protein